MAGPAAIHYLKGLGIMRKLFTRTLFAASSVATAAWLSSAPAFAATFTVTNGDNFNGSTSNFVLIIPSSNIQLKCTGTVSGTAFNGTGSGAGIATIKDMLTCTGPFGVTGTITGNLGSFNAAAISGGIVSGTLTGVTLIVTVSDVLGPCSMQAMGTLGNVTYDNLGTFTITADPVPGLMFSTATGPGCSIILRGGNRATVQATITVNPAFHVSSP